jgi:hypothetical protein
MTTKGGSGVGGEPRANRRILRLVDTIGERSARYPVQSPLVASKKGEVANCLQMFEASPSGEFGIDGTFKEIILCKCHIHYIIFRYLSQTRKRDWVGVWLALPITAFDIAKNVSAGREEKRKTRVRNALFPHLFAFTCVYQTVLGY